MVEAVPSAVLTAVARLVADAPALRDVIGHVAVALCDTLPFERLNLLRLDRPESFVLYVVDPDGSIREESHRIVDSDEPTGPPEGAPSQVITTVRQGARVYGALWATSSTRDAFGPDAQAFLDAVGELLVLAFQRNAILERDLHRSERLESLRRLLHTVAEALDIRSVFPQVLEVVRGGLPHDILALTSWAEDFSSYRIYALAGAQVDDPDFWAAKRIVGADRDHLHGNAYVIHDVAAEVPAESTRGMMFRRVGVRSALRVPMPLGKNMFGSIFFGSRETDAFTEDDIDFARRVADHVALALSHERLAEAARRDAESRETAARLEAQVATLTRELAARGGQRRVVGQSKQWRDVLAHAARVAQTETTVLLTGESGTGKEVAARFIHHASRRSQGPFVAINCAALPDQLLESELFGHERGAFTGAVATKPGRIEQAAAGVLFLDEVGEMAPTVQAKLLRVLEEREFMRLGSTRVINY
jgi:GAF domain-containing protein